MLISQGKGVQYDRETFKIMNKVLAQNSNCVDVGSYRGEILREMVKIVPNGQIFAFEPVPENYHYIVKKFKNVTLFNVALSDKRGTSTFCHVPGRPAKSGLKRLEYPDSNEKINEIVVDVETLDNLIPKSIPVDFIKVDVEGAELSVLRGGLELLKKYKPVVVFEYCIYFAKAYDSTPEKIYDFLTYECGLNISLMTRWLEGKSSYTRDEFSEIVYSVSEFYFMAYPKNLIKS